jgi:hypothetical protein
MDYLGLNLLMQGKYGEAEPLLRDALVIYEADFPDYWRRFSIMNMLGEALVGQKDYAVAEPLLLHGYQGMKEREATIYANWKPRLAQAIERIARFYEATNQPEKAREWRAKLSAGKAP